MNYQPDLFAGAGVERTATNRAQNLSAAKTEMMATNSDTLFDAMRHADDCVCTACGHCPECQDGTTGPAGTYCKRCHRTQRPVERASEPAPAHPVNRYGYYHTSAGETCEQCDAPGAPKLNQPAPAPRACAQLHPTEPQRLAGAYMPSNKWIDFDGIRHTGVGIVSGLYYKAACGKVGLAGTNFKSDCEACR